MTVSPDQSLLYFTDEYSSFVLSAQIQADGGLKNTQKYFRLHERDTDAGKGAESLHCDRDGRLWALTRSGLQVCDQAGRVHCIIPAPHNRIHGFCFGGPEFDTLYCTCGDMVYSRKVKVKGAMPFLPPIKPAPPKL